MIRRIIAWFAYKYRVKKWKEAKRAKWLQEGRDPNEIEIELKNHK